MAPSLHHDAIRARLREIGEALERSGEVMALANAEMRASNRAARLADDANDLAHEEHDDLLVAVRRLRLRVDELETDMRQIRERLDRGEQGKGPS